MRAWQALPDCTMYVGDVRSVLASLPERSVHCVVTSPPYWQLRSYGVDGQIGLEDTPDEYVQVMVEVFRCVWRVLRDDGTLWLNLGDSYNGSGRGPSGHSAVVKNQSKRQGFTGTMHTGAPGLKPKDLVGIPWRVAFALQADGWYLRSAITWCKRAPMPESVQDRPTNATEMIFLLSKRERYFYDAEAVREPAIHEGRVVKAYQPDAKNGQGATDANDRRTASGFLNHDTVVTGRNMRNFWLLGPEPFPDAHFATFPTEIPRRAILAGTSERGVCVACSAPWVRVVERKPDNTGYPNGPGGKKKYQDGGYHRNGLGQSTLAEVARYDVNTLGWRPSCDCNAPTRPAVVLDPFGGSGTTSLVARQLGRHSVYVDLSEQYAAMALRRLQGQALALPLEV